MTCRRTLHCSFTVACRLNFELTRLILAHFIQPRHSTFQPGNVPRQAPAWRRHCPLSHDCVLTGLHHDVIVLQSAVDSWVIRVYRAARVLIVTPSVFSESVFVMKTSLRRTRDVVSCNCYYTLTRSSLIHVF